MRQVSSLILIVLLQIAPASLFAEQHSTDLSEYRSWISEMKGLERGPFARLRWFCRDGTVLPPRAYACKDHGGGYQHGEWSEKTRELRQQGYLVANVLAGLDAVRLVNDPGFRNDFAHILIERFLISADDGWILRRALFYRGAIQEEDERAAARSLLIEMSSGDHWIGPGFVALRTGASLLPHGPNDVSTQKVRHLSAALSDRDAGFKPLRAKIHGTPGVEDAASVRQYAAELADAAQRQPYLELAEEIEGIYRAEALHKQLDTMAAQYTAAPWLQKLLTTSAEKLRKHDSAGPRFTTTAGLLADLRKALPRIKSASVRLDILDLSLRVETENFSAASALRPALTSASRRQQLEFLQAAGLAAYGAGLINSRLHDEMEKSFKTLFKRDPGLDRYRHELAYLGHASGWATQALRMHFAQAMEKLADIEPLARLFIQDQLRGSPLLFYSSILDTLTRDANRLAGVTHRLFGQDIGVGFSALNPGLARGTLHVNQDNFKLPGFKADGIYLLPETVSDLPPVAGIITAGAGNPLSHVQLLARNLGIPNVSVEGKLVDELANHDGQQIVLAVSKSGLVEISPWSDQWNAVFSHSGSSNDVVITPDLEKLDLTVEVPVQLDDLRAEHSGRITGPKAARLGELRARYPDKVARGLAIPFGIFRQEALGQAYPGGDGSVFEWMLGRYAELALMTPDDPQYSVKAEAFRAELYEIIINTKLSDKFQERLRTALTDTFGPGRLPGIFVRSDTNVEDLAGFTGAGLNLTLPNVVAIENLLRAIPEVWASPFTARAFAWRQSHMTQPQHVYTSILLLESVPSGKSGVLVTRDIDSGNRDFLSVVVNEGLGGAVFSFDQ